MFMTSLIAGLSLAGLFICLIILSFIDLKVRLLPNRYVLAFGLFSFSFHVSLGFALLSPAGMAGGALIGFSCLYIIRFFGNRYYGTDSLGLGDVKLMTASGFLLGFDGNLTALTLGAMAALIHGLGYAVFKRITTGKAVSLSQLAVPAGPGFAVGIMLSAALYFL